MTGRTVSHYEILDRVGSGGMGEIYKARDLRLNRIVAVKILPAADVGDEKRRQRFMQEAQAASTLNHPNIVTVHDIMHDDGADLLVMELISGSTLVELIPASGLPVHDVLKYGVQIASALAAAHAAGIVHRDIKPGNIMVTPAGLVKVLDFGLAKPTFADLSGGADATRSIAAPLTVQGSVLGTVNYMSPEQAEGKPLDPRSDIFSFGIVMYEMITGQTAFGRDSLVSTMTAILRDDVAPIGQAAPSTPAKLVEIVDKCLRKDREQRWANMEEVRRELEALKLQFDTGSAATVPIAALTGASHAKAKRSPAWMLVLAALLVAGAGVAVWWFTMGSKSQPVAQTAATTPPPSTAQPPEGAAAPVPDGTLSNDSIIDMVQAKVPAATIAGQIRSARTNFNLSTAEVIRLSKAGVPPSVIEMMRNPANATAPPAVSNPPGSSAPALPTTSGSSTAPSGTAPRPEATPPATSSEPTSMLVQISDGIPLAIELVEDVPLDADSGTSLKFRTTESLKAAGVVVIPKGAVVEGRVVDESKKRVLGISKMTFELAEAEAVSGRRIKVRATPRVEKGQSKRSIEGGSKKKIKDLAAPAGSEFVAYVDGAQTVTVKK